MHFTTVHDIKKSITPERTTLATNIYKHIRDEIITLNLPPGEMVYETELAASFGVSRTPVREAFKLLAAEDFVEILPQRGVRIANISKKKVEESWFIRESLEVSAFKLVARTWNAQDSRCTALRNQVLQMLEDQRQAANSKDYNEFFRLDEQYHKTILRKADNNTLLSFIDQVFGHVNRMRYLEFNETKETEINRIIADHETIFHHVMAGDESAAEAILVKHIRRSTDYARTIMQKNPDYFVEI